MGDDRGGGDRGNHRGRGHTGDIAGRLHRRSATTRRAGSTATRDRLPGGDQGDHRGEGKLKARSGQALRRQQQDDRSEEHTSELPSLMRISYAVFCLTKKKTTSK